MMKLLLSATVVVALSAGGAAQSPPPAAPSFEVASIKKNVSGDPNASVRAQPGGRLTVTNNSLYNMIRNAYGVQRFQMIAGDRMPAWIDSDRWDIVAQAPDDAAPAQMVMMLRHLLVDRFKLVIARETREMPVYALIVARADGRLGPQLKPSSVDCAALMAAASSGGRPPAAGVFCGTRNGQGNIMTSGVPLADFVRNLSPMAGRSIVDQTGLAGPFDLELKWTPDESPTGGVAAPAADGASLFAAIQEQLGLRLLAQRGPVEVLVIESAERPQED